MIALINPNASVEVVKRLGISTPPLGLGYLAAMLRERGFKVTSSPPSRTGLPP